MYLIYPKEITKEWKQRKRRRFIDERLGTSCVQLTPCYVERECRLTYDGMSMPGKATAPDSDVQLDTDSQSDC